MADEEKKESQIPPDAAAAAAAPGGGLVGKLLGIVLPAVLAGAAAFAGAKFGGGHAPAPAHEEGAKKHDEKKTPGLTIDVKTFVVNVQDEKTGDNKPLKMTVAIELEKLAKKEEFEPFLPRIRDTVLSYIRNLTYQQVMNPRTKDRITEDLLEQIHKLGAEQAQRVLVLEMVTQ